MPASTCSQCTGTNAGIDPGRARSARRRDLRAHNVCPPRIQTQTAHDCCALSGIRKRLTGQHNAGDASLYQRHANICLQAQHCRQDPAPITKTLLFKQRRDYQGVRSIYPRWVKRAWSRGAQPCSHRTAAAFGYGSASIQAESPSAPCLGVAEIDGLTGDMIERPLVYPNSGNDNPVHQFVDEDGKQLRAPVDLCLAIDCVRLRFDRPL